MNWLSVNALQILQTRILRKTYDDDLRFQEIKSQCKKRKVIICLCLKFVLLPQICKVSLGALKVAIKLLLLFHKKKVVILQE